MGNLVEAKGMEVVSMQNMAMAGFDDINVGEEISIPYARLLQSNSPELDDNDDLKAGQLLNTMTLEVLEGEIIPLMVTKSNIMFVPREDGKIEAFKQRAGVTQDVIDEGKIVCRSRDGKTGSRFGNCKACPHMKFIGNNPPICDETINVLALVDGQAMPVLIPFSKTSLKHGKQFLQVAFAKSQQDMRAGGNGAIFNSKYKIVSKKNKNAKGSWVELTLVPVMNKPTEDEKLVAQDMYVMCKDLVHTVVEDSVVEDSDAAAQGASNPVSDKVVDGVVGATDSDNVPF